MPETIAAPAAPAAPAISTTTPATPVSPVAGATEPVKTAETAPENPFDKFIAERDAKKAAAAKPEEKTKEKPASAPVKPEDTAKNGGKKESQLHVLGKQYEESQSRVKQLEGELVALKAKAVQPGSEDARALLAKNQDLEKQLKDMDAKLRMKDYGNHPDFINKYDKPFKDAARHAKSVVDSLDVITGKNPETDQPITRPAKFDADFAIIYQLPRDGARRMAREMFGQDAPEVMAEYDKLHGLEEAKANALKEHESGLEEMTKKERAEMLATQEKMANAFEAAKNDLVEQKAKLFGNDPEDKEGNETFQKALAVVARGFYEREHLTPQEQVLHDANTMLYAAFGLTAETRLAAQAERIAELESRINGKTESRAGTTRKSGAETPVDEDKTDFSEAGLRKDPLLKAAFGQT